jgi:hypothetical protein
MTNTVFRHGLGLSAIAYVQGVNGTQATPVKLAT